MQTKIIETIKGIVVEDWNSGTSFAEKEDYSHLRSPHREVMEDGDVYTFRNMLSRYNKEVESAPFDKSQNQLLGYLETIADTYGDRIFDKLSKFLEPSSDEELRKDAEYHLEQLLLLLEKP